MSTSIDNRIVEMQFNNSQFEKGIAQSQRSLEEFNQSLKFEGAETGAKNLSKALNTIDTGKIQKGIENISNSISTMEIAAIAAISTISSRITNLIGNWVSSGIKTALEGATSGFHKYEAEVGSVQTLLLATGLTIEDVTTYLDELRWYADETSYSYTDMTSALQKFTSAGIDIETALPAVMGISNEAASAGGNIRSASIAMYNFAQALSLGYVGSRDWFSIQNQNLATADFKKNIVEVAKELGTLGENVTVEQAFSDLSTRWFSSDVLIEVLKRYGSFAEQIYDYQNEMGFETASEAMQNYTGNIIDFSKKGFLAAQEAKTFTDSVSAIKDVLSSGWSATYTNIFGNYEEAADFWTDFTNTIINGIYPIQEFRNTMLETWKTSGRFLGGRMEVIYGLRNLADSLEIITEKTKKWLGYVFKLDAETLGNKLAKLSADFNAFTSKIKIFTRDSGDKVAIIFLRFAKALQIVFDTTKKSLSPIKTFFSNFITNQDNIDNVLRIFSNLALTLQNIAGFIDFLITPLTDAFNIVFGNSDGKSGFVDAVANLSDNFVDLTGLLPQVDDGTKETTSNMEKLTQVMIGLFSTIELITYILGTFLSTLFGYDYGDPFKNLRTSASDDATSLLDTLVEMSKGIQETSTFLHESGAVEDFSSGVAGVLKTWLDFAGGIGKRLKENILPILEEVGGRIKTFFEEHESTIRPILDGIKNLYEGFVSWLKGILGITDKEGEEVTEAVGNSTAAIQQAYGESRNGTPIKGGAPGPGKRDPLFDLGEDLEEKEETLNNTFNLATIISDLAKRVKEKLSGGLSTFWEVLNDFIDYWQNDEDFKEISGPLLKTAKWFLIFGVVFSISYWIYSTIKSVTDRILLVPIAIMNFSNGFMIFAKSFKQMVKAFKRQAFANVLKSLALTILSIGAVFVTVIIAIKSLQDVPIDELSKSLMVITPILVILMTILLVILHYANEMSNANNAGKAAALFSSIGVLFISLAASFMLIAVSIKMLTSTINSIQSGSDPGGVWIKIGTILGLYSAMLLLILLSVTQMKSSTDFIKGVNIFGIASVIISIGITMMLIVKSLGMLVKIVEEYDRSGFDAFDKALTIIGATVVSLFVLSIFMINKARSTNPTEISGVAKIILSISLSIFIIIGAISLLTVIMSKIDQSGFDTFDKALTIIGVALLSLMTFVILTTHFVSENGAAVKLGGLVTSIIFALLAVVLSIAMLAHIMDVTNDTFERKLLIASGIVGVTLLVLEGGIASMIGLSKVANPNALSSTVGLVTAFTFAILAVSACIGMVTFLSETYGERTIITAGIIIGAAMLIIGGSVASIVGLSKIAKAQELEQAIILLFVFAGTLAIVTICLFALCEMSARYNIGTIVASGAILIVALAIIGVATAAMTEMAGKSNPGSIKAVKEILLSMIGVIAMFTLCLAAITLMMNISKDPSYVVGAFGMLTLFFIEVAALMLLFTSLAKSLMANKISKAWTDKIIQMLNEIVLIVLALTISLTVITLTQKLGNVWSSMGVLLISLAAIGLFMLGLMGIAKLMKSSSLELGQIAIMLTNITTLMAILTLCILGISAAARITNGVDPKPLLVIMASFAAMLGLVALITKIPGLSTNSLLKVSLATILIAMAMSKAAGAFKTFVPALGELLSVFETHKETINSIVQNAGDYAKFAGVLALFGAAFIVIGIAAIVLGTGLVTIGLALSIIAPLTPILVATFLLFKELILWLSENIGEVLKASVAILALGIAVGIAAVPILLLSVALVIAGIGLVAFSTGLMTLMSILPTIPPLLAAFLVEMKALKPVILDGLKSLIDGFFELLEFFFERLAEFLSPENSERIATIIETLKNLIVVIFTAICEAIQEMDPVLTETLKVVITDLINLLTELVPEFVELCDTVFKSLLDSITTNTPLIIDAILEIITGITNSFAEQTPELIESIGSYLMAIITGINTFLDNHGVELASGLATLANNILEFTTAALTQTFLTGGPSIAEGIFEGIMNGIKNFDGWDAIRDLFGGAEEEITAEFESVNEDVQDNLDEHSPSRLTAETGENFVAGYGVGVEEGTEGLGGILQSAGEKIKDLFTNAFSGVTSDAGNSFSDFFASAGERFTNWKDSAGEQFEGLGGNIVTVLKDQFGEVISSDAFGGLSDLFGGDDGTSSNGNTAAMLAQQKGEAAGNGYGTGFISGLTDAFGGGDMTSILSDLGGTDMTEFTITPVIDDSQISDFDVSSLGGDFDLTGALNGTSFADTVSDDFDYNAEAGALTGNGDTYIEFNQTNNSPEALSRLDIYRDTQNMLSGFPT